MPGYGHGMSTEGRAARLCMCFGEGPQALGLSGHWSEVHDQCDSVQLLSHLPHAEVTANRWTVWAASTRRRWGVRQWSPLLRSKKTEAAVQVYSWVHKHS